MLVHYLHARPIDGALWIVVVVLQLLASIAVRYSGMHRTHPVFTLYVYFSLLANAVLMAIPVAHGFAIYTWVSSSLGAVQTLIEAACVAALYRRVLGPKTSLPVRVPRDLRILLAMAAGLSITIGLIFRPRYGSSGYRALMQAQSIVVLLVVLALAILLGYGARIAHFVHERAAQIAIGFVLMLSVNAISLLVVLAGGRGFTWPAQRTGQLFGMMAFGWWTWKLSYREAAREEASPEIEAEVFRLNEQDAAALEAAANQNR